VALFALAADQYSAITADDELVSKSTVSALKAMLQKQASMDKEEAGLFAKLTTKKKAVVHHQAAVKKAKHASQKDDEVAKLKAELAAAEAKDKKDTKKVLASFGLARTAHRRALALALMIVSPR
jgi:hypothetical protein